MKIETDMKIYIKMNINMKMTMTMKMKMKIIGWKLKFVVEQWIFSCSISSLNAHSKIEDREITERYYTIKLGIIYDDQNKKWCILEFLF